MFNKLYSIAYKKIFSDTYVNNKKSLHYSFLVKKGKILSGGINKEHKTHTLSKKFGYWRESQHAELVAILSVEMPHRFKLVNGSSLWNFRFQRDGSLAWSRPCEKCFGLALAFNISKVYYSVGPELKPNMEWIS